MIISRNGYIKLIDFGLVSYLENGEMERTRGGTSGYIAPEKLEKKPYDMAVDMFSLGVLIVVLARGRGLFK